MLFQPAKDDRLDYLRECWQNSNRTIVLRVKFVSRLEQWRNLGEFPQEWHLVLFEAEVDEMGQDRSQGCPYALH